MKIIPESGGHCITGDVDLTCSGDRIAFGLGDRDLAGSHTVSLRIEDRSGDVLADVEDEVVFERVQPNGSGCPPVCWQAEVQLPA